MIIIKQKQLSIIKKEDNHKFYCRKEWHQIREKVLKMDHYECQKCRRKGRYKRAVLVHHINHLKDRPDLALEIFDDDGKRNLISLCQSCHEEEHPEERHRWQKKKDEFNNEERW